ncbi:MAG: barstar family protein [Polyangiaceae bacterium]|nr:barstar family protein [Polyangiaceae bacterium]
MITLEQAPLLLRPVREAVWFTKEGLSPDARTFLLQRGCQIAHLDLDGLEGAADLFKRLARVLSFPKYFGYNWDALDEVLADLELSAEKGLVLVAHSSFEAWQSESEVMGRLVAAWLLAAENWVDRNVSLHLVMS